MGIEEQILMEENELEPNRYIANAVLFFLPIIIAIEIVNHLNLFHVNPDSLHQCTLTCFFCVALIEFLGRETKISNDPRVKYVIMSLLLLQTLTISTLLMQWTELLIALPLVLALQYHNRGVTSFTIIGTLLVALVSGPLAILLHLPQLDYYEYLIRSIGYKVSEIQPDPDYNVFAYILSALKYMSIPRCIVVTALSPTSIYITKLTSSNIESRAKISFLSSYDVMTGLYNRMSFEQKCKDLTEHCPDPLICVYADANGLHGLNNDFGHAAGDEFLRVCAKLLKESFCEWCYRIGGDEFVSFITDVEMDEVLRIITQIQKDLAVKGYHMSLGAARCEKNMTIEKLVQSAEVNMYHAKHDYYVKTGKDRRNAR